MRPEYLTNQYGFIVDYLAEYLREMRMIKKIKALLQEEVHEEQAQDEGLEP